MTTYKFNLEVKVEAVEEDDIEVIKAYVQDALEDFTEVNITHTKTEEE